MQRPAEPFIVIGSVSVSAVRGGKRMRGMGGRPCLQYDSNIHRINHLNKCQVVNMSFSRYGCL